MSEPVRCPECRGIKSGQPQHSADMPCTCWMNRATSETNSAPIKRRSRQQAEDTLSIWVLYDHPSDYPDLFIARRFDVGPGGQVIATTELLLAADVEWLRKEMRKKALVRIGRHQTDDPVIIESWL